MLQKRRLGVANDRMGKMICKHLNLDGLKTDEYRGWQALPERNKFFRMGAPPVMVDILPEISGVDFDSAWQRRVKVLVDPQRGLTACFISSGDFAAGRPQDIADVAALRKAAKSRGPEPEI
jgi:hypothetical protein